MNTTRAQKINVKSQWHTEQIKAAIRMRGVSLKELAAQNGLQAAAISFALTNPHRPAERAIAKFLGVPLHELWPDRWTADGQRIRPRYAYLYINTDACSVAA